MRIRLAFWAAASRARCSSGEILGLAGAAFWAGFAAGAAAGVSGKCRVFLARSGIVRGDFATWSERYSGILGGSVTAAHRCHHRVMQYWIGRCIKRFAWNCPMAAMADFPSVTQSRFHILPGIAGRPVRRSPSPGKSCCILRLELDKLYLERLTIGAEAGVAEVAGLWLRFGPILW